MWSKKPRQICFLKNQKFCSTVNRLSGLLIKQPEKQEVAQDETAPVLHLLFCYYDLFNEVWHVFDASQSNQLDIFGSIIWKLARLVHGSH